MKKPAYGFIAILMGIFSVVIVNTKSLPYRIPIGLTIGILNLVFAYVYIIRNQPAKDRKVFLVYLLIALCFILAQFII
jgi:glucose uptake protein GlcU